MNCLEFRQAVGAEPGTQQHAIAEHRAACAACARHHDRMLALDALLLRALQVDPPAQRPAAASSPAPVRRGWLALAASLVAALGLGLGLWLSEPAPSLADEVLGHVRHEPGALRLAQPMAAQAVDEVLRPEGARLRAGLGDVTFAERCIFEGHAVPHLVVRTAAGTVTVLMLSHRQVAGPQRLDDDRFAGVVLPAPRGSIAIVGEGPMPLESIAQQVTEAVEWDT